MIQVFFPGFPEREGGKLGSERNGLNIGFRSLEVPWRSSRILDPIRRALLHLVGPNFFSCKTKKYGWISHFLVVFSISLGLSDSGNVCSLNITHHRKHRQQIYKFVPFFQSYFCGQFGWSKISTTIPGNQDSFWTASILVGDACIALYNTTYRGTKKETKQLKSEFGLNLILSFLRHHWYKMDVACWCLLHVCFLKFHHPKWGIAKWATKKTRPYFPWKTCCPKQQVFFHCSNGSISTFTLKTVWATWLQKKCSGNCLNRCS